MQVYFDSCWQLVILVNTYSLSQVSWDNHLSSDNDICLSHIQTANAVSYAVRHHRLHDKRPALYKVTSSTTNTTYTDHNASLKTKPHSYMWAFHVQMTSSIHPYIRKYRTTVTYLWHKKTCHPEHGEGSWIYIMYRQSTQTQSPSYKNTPRLSFLAWPGI